METFDVEVPELGCVLLLRHGETEGQSSIRFHGSTDVALADLGREQIRRTVCDLDLTVYERVLCSPMRRALESVQAILPGCEPEIVEDFREIDFGACEGLTAEEIAHVHPTFHERWRAGQVDRFPDGEPFDGFVQRVQDAGHALLKRRALVGKSMIVAHKGTLKALLADWLRLPPGDRHRFDPPLGGGFLIRGPASRW